MCFRVLQSNYSCRCLTGLSDLESAYSQLLSYTNRGYVPRRFITGSLGVRTRRRRRKLLMAACSLLFLWDWRASLRTSSRSSLTLGLGMGREAQRSEQELYSPVSITRTENILTYGLFTMYSKKLHRLCKCHFHKAKLFHGKFHSDWPVTIDSK